MNTFQRNILLTGTVVLFIGFLSCTTVEKTTEEDEPKVTTDGPQAEAGEVTELQEMLNRNRSSLQDVYLSQKQDMPEHFTKSDSGNNKSLNNNPYDGFRVQILSTREIEIADSVANSFRVWSDTTITGYNPEAHVSFRQPYYKVHIGDFQQRDQANRFSRLIKIQFPDAWVVHDRIEPSNVPADTAEFTFQKPEPLEVDSLDLESE